MAEEHDQHNLPPAPLCAPPPLDHLRMAESAPIAMPLLAEGITYDRKTGDPGPKVRPYGTQKDPDSDAEQEEEEPKKAEEKPKTEDDGDGEAPMGLVEVQNGNIPAEQPQEPKPEFTPEQKAKIRETLEDLKLIFPHLKDDWLQRSVTQAMAKWEEFDPERIVNWIYEYENLAPRKEQIFIKHSVLMKVDDYDTARKMLRAMKHDIDENYKYFAEVKLTQKFPHFSIYSLRQVLQDCDYMYPLAVLNIMEGLEQALKEDKRPTKEWKKNEFIYISMQKASDKKWYKYPLCVVKGEKFWCKKKAKMMGFPGILAREVRLVEKALGAYEQRFIRLKEKFEAEAEKKERLLQAIESGIALDCPICMENFLPEEQVTCTNGHEFCIRCLQGAVKEAVTGQLQLSPQGELQCISGKCTGIFPLVMLCHMLPPESLAMFEERLWTDFIAKSGLTNLNRCPKCGYMEEVEVPVEVLKLFECKNLRCGHKSCRQCKSPWDEHAGKGCKEMQVDPETALRMKYDDMMTEVFLRRCIACRRPQMKSEGCNKLACPCGSRMCYLCRKPLNDLENPYMHFCQCTSEVCICGRCKLFAEPTHIDDALREKLMAQLQEELVELRLQQSKASEAMVSKMTGVDSIPKTAVAVVGGPAEGQIAQAPQGQIAPQQRQFAAIFGGQ